ncbi:MAG: heterodisulfide reductase-related iron-sulfur binding cluster [Candidatus Bathyarchaeia archaeon]
MKRIYYFPGCTYLRFKSEDFSVRNALKVLGFELIDVPQWTCCGALYPPTSNLVTGWAFSFRNLLNASRRGIKEILTTCPFCYRNLALVNKITREKRETCSALNELVEGEYTGDVEVLHLLQLLNDPRVLKSIEENVKRDVNIKVVPFYGCALLRPSEIAIDSPERPVLMEKILKAARYEVLDFYPTKIECCGNYLPITGHKNFVRRIYRILNHANRLGAQAIVTICTLCHYNLDAYQDEIQSTFKDFNKIPILHLGQVLSLAFGLPIDVCHFSDHKVNPYHYLKEVIK